MSGLQHTAELLPPEQPARDRYQDLPGWQQVRPFTYRTLDQLHPGEQHGFTDSHCINPKCEHNWTPEEELRLVQYGQITCPSCGTLQNITGGYGAYPSKENQQERMHLEFQPGGGTKSGLSLTQMGDIGEQVVARIGTLPCGPILKWFRNEGTYNNPIDMICGDGKTNYGVEVKTIHSLAQPRFRLGNARDRQRMIQFCGQNGLRQGLIGVRLNFYTDKADVFFRTGFTDSYIGAGAMQFVGTYDFADLNPFRAPSGQHEVPKLPEDNGTNDIDELFGPPSMRTSMEIPWDDPFGRDKVWKYVYHAPTDRLLMKMTDEYDAPHHGDLMMEMGIPEEEMWGPTTNQGWISTYRDYDNKPRVNVYSVTAERPNREQEQVAQQRAREEFARQQPYMAQHMPDPEDMEHLGAFGEGFEQGQLPIMFQSPLLQKTIEIMREYRDRGEDWQRVAEVGAYSLMIQLGYNEDSQLDDQARARIQDLLKQAMMLFSANPRGDTPPMDNPQWDSIFDWHNLQPGQEWLRDYSMERGKFEHDDREGWHSERYHNLGFPNNPFLSSAPEEWEATHVASDIPWDKPFDQPAGSTYYKWAYHPAHGLHIWPTGQGRDGLPSHDQYTVQHFNRPYDSPYDNQDVYGESMVTGDGLVRSIKAIPWSEQADPETAEKLLREQLPVIHGRPLAWPGEWHTSAYRPGTRVFLPATKELGQVERHDYGWYWIRTDNGTVVSAPEGSVQPVNVPDALTDTPEQIDTMVHNAAAPPDKIYEWVRGRIQERIKDIMAALESGDEAQAQSWWKWIMFECLSAGATDEQLPFLMRRINLELASTMGQNGVKGDGAMLGNPEDMGWTQMPSDLAPQIKGPNQLQGPGQWEDEDRWLPNGNHPAVMKPVWDYMVRQNHTAAADHSGAMVAIFAPAKAARKLHVEDGEPTEDMHITLAYFADKAADRDDWDDAKAVVGEVAREFGPLEVTIGGVGVFDGKGDEKPLIGTVDAPGIAELHVALKERLDAAGFPLNEEHGFSPHLTIKYLKGDEEWPEIPTPVDWEAAEITLVVGGDRSEFKLTGEHRTAEGPDKHIGDKLTALIEGIQNGSIPGFSLQPGTFNPMDVKGYVVSQDGGMVIPVSDITTGDLVEMSRRALETGRGAFVGGWVEGGFLYLDLSYDFDRREDAEAFGLAQNQLAIYNAGSDEVLDRRDDLGRYLTDAEYAQATSPAHEGTDAPQAAGAENAPALGRPGEEVGGAEGWRESAFVSDTPERDRLNQEYFDTLRGAGVHESLINPRGPKNLGWNYRAPWLIDENNILHVGRFGDFHGDIEGVDRRAKNNALAYGGIEYYQPENFFEHQLYYRKPTAGVPTSEEAQKRVEALLGRPLRSDQMQSDPDDIDWNQAFAKTAESDPMWEEFERTKPPSFSPPKTEIVSYEEWLASPIGQKAKEFNDTYPRQAFPLYSQYLSWIAQMPQPSPPDDHTAKTADWEMNLRPGHRVLWNGEGHTVTNAGQDDIHNRLNPHLMPPEGHVFLRPDRPTANYNEHRDYVAAPLHELTRLPDYQAGDRVSGSSDDNPYWHGTVVGVKNNDGISNAITDAMNEQGGTDEPYDPTLLVRWDHRGLGRNHPASLRMVQPAADLPADPESFPDTLPWGEDEQNYYRNAAVTADWQESEHPRNDKGEFVVKHEQHEVKVYDHKGKHTHTVKRCKHCGVLYYKEPKERNVKCPTCGENPERKLRSVSKKEGAADNQDSVADEFGWKYWKTNSNGHRMYQYGGPNGLGQYVLHTVTGSGSHGDPIHNAKMLRTHMKACMNGTCRHAALPGAEISAMPGAPVLRPGTKVMYGGKTWWIMDTEGELAHIYDDSGAEDIVPTPQLQAVASTE